MLTCLISSVCFWCQIALFNLKSQMEAVVMCGCRMRCMAIQAPWLGFDTCNISVSFSPLFTASLQSNNYRFGLLFSCRILHLQLHGFLYFNACNVAFIYKGLQLSGYLIVLCSSLFLLLNAQDD